MDKRQDGVVEGRMLKTMTLRKVDFTQLLHYDIYKDCWFTKLIY